MVPREHVTPAAERATARAPKHPPPLSMFTDVTDLCDSEAEDEDLDFESTAYSNNTDFAERTLRTQGDVPQALGTVVQCWRSNKKTENFHSLVFLSDFHPPRSTRTQKSQFFPPAAGVSSHFLISKFANPSLVF